MLKVSMEVEDSCDEVVDNVVNVDVYPVIFLLNIADVSVSDIPRLVSDLSVVDGKKVDVSILVVYVFREF